MRRAVITRRTTDAGGVVLRAGERDIAVLGQLRADDDGTMSTTFTHRPAFADVAEAFRRLAAASDAEAVSLSEEIEAAGVHVWHVIHAMRIDVPRTVRILRGEVRFRPTDAFQTMRSGGLG